MPAGRVHGAGGGVYRVVLDDGCTVSASLRGRLKQRPRRGGRVVIGDRVAVSATGDAWTVESVEERATALVRRGRGGRTAKVLAANLDRVFAMVAAKDPDATVELVDRLLVLIESSGMHPSLVVNKVDKPGAAEVAESLAGLYEGIGYHVLLASAESGAGLDALQGELCRGISALIGPSGVGKSSVLNALDPSLGLRTGELSRKTGTGRHTTVSSRLIHLSCGGLVADTPGFGDVGLWGVAPERVADCFPELRAPAEQCRFRRCSHEHEPDCGVRQALEEGRIAESRFASYVTLRREAVEAASE